MKKDNKEKKKFLEEIKNIIFLIFWTYSLTMIFCLGCGITYKDANLYSLIAIVFIIFCLIYNFFKKE